MSGLRAVGALTQPEFTREPLRPVGQTVGKHRLAPVLFIRRPVTMVSKWYQNLLPKQNSWSSGFSSSSLLERVPSLVDAVIRAASVGTPTGYQPG